MTINLPKCEFGQAQITYFGYTVGQGQVMPKQANMKASFRFSKA